MRLVILGAPGSGRRTQASLLATKYGLTTLTSTELVKVAMSEESEQGLQLRLLHETGQAVTEDIILSLLQARLSQPDMQAGFVLDGFPRNLLQALTLDEMLAEIGQPLDFLILIHIETDALMERLVGRRTCHACGATYNIYTHPTVVEDVCDACGGRLHRRNDDNEETVSNRLHVFDHLTSQLLSHYSKQEKVLRVDGDGEVDEVFARVCEAVDVAVSQPRAEPVQTVPAEMPTAQQKATSPDSEASSKKSSARKQPKKSAAKPSAGQNEKNVASKSTARSAGGGAQGRQKQGTSAKQQAAKQVVKSQPNPKQVAVKKTPSKKSTIKPTEPSKGVSGKSNSTKRPTTGAKKKQTPVNAPAKTIKKKTVTTKKSQQRTGKAVVKTVKKTAKSPAKKALSRPRR